MTKACAEIAAELGYEIPDGAVFREAEDNETPDSRQALLSRMEELATENNELKIKLKSARQNGS